MLDFFGFIIFIALIGWIAALFVTPIVDKPIKDRFTIFGYFLVLLVYYYFYSAQKTRKFFKFLIYKKD